jgi:RimJ/RimL family protein N-acetyltransferase
MRPLASERLVLEPQRAVHAAAMFEVLSDPAIYEHENEPPRSLAWLRERYARLESRRSSDGGEAWLNWVVRLRGGAAAPDGCIGYVQASVHDDGSAAVAYEFGSRWWGRGYASEAVAAMIDELGAAWGVRRLHAVLKRSNARSARLLERLGFGPAAPELAAACRPDDDERVMARML